jgi:hypothetical protein
MNKYRAAHNDDKTSYNTMELILYVFTKNVDIKFSAHDAFLE